MLSKDLFHPMDNVLRNGHIGIDKKENVRLRPRRPKVSRATGASGRGKAMDGNASCFCILRGTVSIAIANHDEFIWWRHGKPYRIQTRAKLCPPVVNGNNDCDGQR